MNNPQTKSARPGYFNRIKFALPALALLLLAVPARLQAGNDNRAPDVPAAIATPGNTNKVHFHVYAVGVQIYVWSGTNWVFRAPEAALFDADGNTVGIHYAGPTWESESGSMVVGARVSSAPSPNANSIPQLLLKATSSTGPGIFEGTTYVQRVNTLGGVAPSTPGTVVGEEARVAYVAEYYFYRDTR